MKDANSAPVYACMYKGLAELSREHGYALAAHGSMARDFDVVAIPWVDHPDPAESLIDAILDKYALNQIGEPEMKNHGRKCWTLSLGFGDTFLDFSIMPFE